MKEHCVRVIKCHFERFKREVFSDIGNILHCTYKKDIKENENKSMETTFRDIKV